MDPVIKLTLVDVVESETDGGRDRTGAFAALTIARTDVVEWLA